MVDMTTFDKLPNCRASEMPASILACASVEPTATSGERARTFAMDDSNDSISLQVVNRIDNVSKVIFPSLYILFNIIYWVAFLYWIPDEVDQILKFTEKG
ncbi:unnamed protein product [Cylicostephanus goldi]|uniref:Neurotransmitter-gated ion-channel transmembrane domain-containing protein n=1 Tax=Cylicostephanus goldi TaxID=71465 RepID=A0A3P7M4T2_CYLGO|nr:unnamed protein product [Cylicostephanus goldi]